MTRIMPQRDLELPNPPTDPFAILDPENREIGELFLYAVQERCATDFEYLSVVCSVCWERNS